MKRDCAHYFWNKYQYKMIAMVACLEKCTYRVGSSKMRCSQGVKSGTSLSMCTTGDAYVWVIVIGMDLDFPPYVVQVWLSVLYIS